MGRNWIRHSEASETRANLKAALKGWWKVARPIKAWELYQELRAASEHSRRASNRRFLARRMADASLAGLNEEQRRAVLVQEDRTLVIAGAGTGKTHTMVEKAKDTVRTGIAKSQEIAFVTFTRKAAREIHSRSSEIEGMEIGTIHHLARRVIELAEGARPRLSPLVEDDKKRRDLIEAWLTEAIGEDPSLLIDLETRRQAFQRCRAPEGDETQHYRVPPDGILVKSIGEALIATTLYLAETKFIYEAGFPVPASHRSLDGRGYRPDFYIPDDLNASPSVQGGIWFEHYAFGEGGELPAHWDEETPGTTAEYRESRSWKDRLHKDLGTRYVWTEVADMQRCIKQRKSFPKLVLRRLEELGVTGIRQASNWGVKRELDRLKAEAAGASHWRITFEIDEWIRTSRQQVSLDRALRATATRRVVMAEAHALYRISAPVLNRYEKHLEESGTVDHEGTILKAWKYLREGTVAPPWKVILVDEYQDVNPAQAAFLHALLRPRRSDRPSTGARLTAVGDDWQAIFAFQGGDVDLIRDFKDPSGGFNRYRERVALRQTYRFGQPLADTTRRFVTLSAGAIDREVIGSPKIAPDARWPSSVVIASSRLTEKGKQEFGDGHRGLTGGVLAALARIHEQRPAASVLILGRRNVDLEPVRANGQRGIGLDRRTIRRVAAARDQQLVYSTVHKAKGTEADYVVFLDTGPPRAGERAGNRALERALSVFRGSDSSKEEERRIWYVALTRARRKVYIIVAADTEAHSPFADELYHNAEGQFDVGEDELAEYLEATRPHVPCPVCSRIGRTGSVLAKRTSRNGSFAGCTSFSAGEEYRCGHTERLCGRCADGLMVRLGNGRARCQRPNCAYEVPLCKCTVPRPMVERRNSATGSRFWGCQMYPKSESCRATRRMRVYP